jgi:hypothetical protein
MKAAREADRPGDSVGTDEPPAPGPAGVGDGAPAALARGGANRADPAGPVVQAEGPAAPGAVAGGRPALLTTWLFRPDEAPRDCAPGRAAPAGGRGREPGMGRSGGIRRAGSARAGGPARAPPLRRACGPVGLATAAAGGPRRAVLRHRHGALLEAGAIGSTRRSWSRSSGATSWSACMSYPCPSPRGS